MPGVAVDEEEAAGGTGEDGGTAVPATDIDVVDLARRVYELMRAELRVEQARGASTLRHP
jgi:hypothetical protein